MQEIFNAQIFRDAAAVTKLLREGVEVADVSPVERASTHLDAFGIRLEDFLQKSPVDRAKLWIGAQAVLKKKERTDPILFSAIREMAGATRDIRRANGKLDRTHIFLDTIGTLCNH
jgi:hypothetical protein